MFYLLKNIQKNVWVLKKENYIILFNVQKVKNHLKHPFYLFFEIFSRKKQLSESRACANLFEVSTNCKYLKIAFLKKISKNKKKKN